MKTLEKLEAHYCRYFMSLDSKNIISKYFNNDEEKLFFIYFNKEIESIFLLNNLRAGRSSLLEHKKELERIGSTAKKLSEQLSNMGHTSDSFIRQGLLIAGLNPQNNLSINLSDKLFDIYLAIETIKTDLKGNPAGRELWEREELITAIYKSWVKASNKRPPLSEDSVFVKLSQNFLIDFGVTPSMTPAPTRNIISYMKKARLKLRTRSKEFNKILK